MIKIARLSITTDEDTGMKDVLKAHMDKCGVSMREISVRGDGFETHYGNWVLVPCLDNEALKKLADSMGTEIDMHDAVLEQSDIDRLSVGDKVRVRFIGSFDQTVDSDGRVDAIKEDEIVILQKHKYGWVFKAGERCSIEKI